jgi:asparagine synthase (glutamine-hydrolysing)
MLQDSPDFLLLGRPRFQDPALARLAADQGAEAAWRSALRGRHIAEVAQAVDGPYAVALREPDGRVLLAVDRFAIRTLCYRVNAEGIRFAERADALGVRELDAQALLDYLYFHVVPSPRTVFAGVRRLPPAHCAVFEGGRLTVIPYWVPRFEPLVAPDFTALGEEFRALLRQSVADALGAGKPACFLSGGTDSSTVAGMIGLAAGRPAATYSIGFEAEGYDEMHFARIAARHFGTEHHEHYVSADALVDAIPGVAAHYDQPFGNSSAVPAHLCASMAQADGVERLLAGDGGDELFGGNSRYATQRIFGWYDNVPPPLRTGLLEPLLTGSPLGRLPLLRKGASYVRQARIPMPDRSQAYNLLLRMDPLTVLAPGFAARVDLQEPQAQQRLVWREATHDASELDRTLAYDWRYTLAETDLPKVCGGCALAGIEVAFPMLDRRLVEFSMRLPSSYKLKRLQLRWFFKEALRGFLPDETLAKKKQGFGLPFGVWVVRHDRLRTLATDSLHSLATRGIVAPRFLDDLLATHLPAHPHYYGEMVWILMTLEQWLQHHAPDHRQPD